MRIVGGILMAFGTFCICVVLASLLGPMMRAVGFDVSGATTSVVGTGLIGALSLSTGALLRRRVVERGGGSRAPRAGEGAPSGALPPGSTADAVEWERMRNERTKAR